jgi:hypothetical protein
VVRRSAAVLGVTLAAGVLAAGCSTAPAASTPAVAAPSDVAVVATADELTAPTGFRVSLDPVEVPATAADGRDLVQWEVDWTLTWEPVAGAAEHAVWFGTNEGAPSEPRRSVDEPELRLTAAAGTSPAARLAADREAGLLFTSSQLLVSVAARAADGRLGPRSPWYPVGDAPADGRPVGTAAPGHGH